VSLQVHSRRIEVEIPEICAHPFSLSLIDGKSTIMITYLAQVDGTLESCLWKIFSEVVSSTLAVGMEADENPFFVACHPVYVEEELCTNHMATSSSTE
jgi:hypothetical protein